MKVRVTNIQRFSLNDGPGIRTTVFFKGCGLKCPWCSNPENINFKIEKYYNNETKEEGFFGYDITLDELEKEIMKDKSYYALDNGGVTFSGGEALLQFNKLESLLKNLKEEKINMCIETSLFAPIENLKIAIKYLDEFIVDVKTMDNDMCKKVLKGNLDLYLKNIHYLFNNFKGDIIIRIPISKEYTLKGNNLKKIIEILQKYKPTKIEIFQIHSLGESKYKSLNRECIKYEAISNKEMNNIIKEFEDSGLNVTECRI